MPAIDAPPEPAREVSILHPIARSCTLGAIPAIGYQDFFLYHPYDGTLEAVYVSAIPEADVSDLSIQLVQSEEGTIKELSPFEGITKLTVSGQEIPAGSDLGEGPVFVRIKTASIAVTVLVTIHVLTSEIR